MPLDRPTSQYTAPEFDKSALVTIDVQRDVLDGGALEVPGSSEARGAISRVCSCFRHLGRPIVHAVRLYRADGLNVDACRRAIVEAGEAILLAGEPGSELVPDILVDKTIRL